MVHVCCVLGLTAVYIGIRESKAWSWSERMACLLSDRNGSEAYYNDPYQVEVDDHHSRQYALHTTVAILLNTNRRRAR